MSRIVYVNGAFVPEEEARVSVFDRGFLMADAVYEVTSVLDGRLVDFPGHMARLRRSLAELEMAEPASEQELLGLHRELVAQNGLEQGLVYLQVTRGAPPERDFAFPEASVPPTLVMFTQEKPQLVDSPLAPATDDETAGAVRATAELLASLGHRVDDGYVPAVPKAFK